MSTATNIVNSIDVGIIIHFQLQRHLIPLAALEMKYACYFVILKLLATGKCV